VLGKQTGRAALAGRPEPLDAIGIDRAKHGSAPRPAHFHDDIVVAQDRDSNWKFPRAPPLESRRNTSAVTQAAETACTVFWPRFRLPPHDGGKTTPQGTRPFLTLRGKSPWHSLCCYAAKLGQRRLFAPAGEGVELSQQPCMPSLIPAAMGQQDCGQCGYSCQDYSDAIVSKKEERLNLCVPRGKETTHTA